MSATLNLDELEQLAAAATRGPWRWSDARVPDLVGVAGDPEIYQYESEVLEATHWGGCECRSACELELNITTEDAAFIAGTGPDVVQALIARIRELEAA